MKTLILALQIFVVIAPPPPSQAEAIQILTAAPGLSNRTGWRPAPADVPGWPRAAALPAPTAARPAAAAPAPETAQGRANRMGIPGGWTTLEWAILHAGPLTGPSSGGQK